MRKIFADTVYWVALINLEDQWRSNILKASKRVANVPIVTSDEVLVETLNYFAESGPYLRRIALENVRAILLNQSIGVISCSHDAFLDAVELYEKRPDKGYSLTDCISMNTCRELGISEILTHDDHFAQEGFTVLL